MQQFIYLLLVVGVSVSAYPKKSDDIQPYIFEPQIKAMIENLRQQLQNGLPQSGIPPLDPLVFNKFPLKMKQLGIDVDVNMTGKVDGLLGFVINDLKLGFGAPGGGFKLTYDVEFPKIDIVLSPYQMDVKIMKEPYFGDGTILCTIDGLKLNGTGIVGYQNPFLFLKDISIELFLNDFSFEITGWMDDKEQSIETSEMISKFVPDFLVSYHDGISNTLSEFILKFIDGKQIDITKV